MPELVFKELNLKNFKEYKDYILNSESTFPEKIRSAWDDYEWMLSDKDNISLVAFLDSEYLGNVIGCTLIEEEFEEYGIDKRIKVIYLYNIVVESKFQGKGYGYKLLEKFINEARKRGFELLIGHFRPNQSLTLIKKFGAEIVKIHENWEDSGEDFAFCELDLTK